jgi:hypothetical protein
LHCRRIIPTKKELTTGSVPPKEEELTEESIMLGVDDLRKRWGLDEDGVFTLWAKHGLRFFTGEIIRGYPIMRPKMHTPGKEPYQLYQLDDVLHRLLDVEAFEQEHGQTITKLGGRLGAPLRGQQHPKDDYQARQNRLVQETGKDLRGLNPGPSISVKDPSQHSEIRAFKNEEGRTVCEQNLLRLVSGRFQRPQSWKATGKVRARFPPTGKCPLYEKWGSLPSVLRARFPVNEYPLIGHSAAACPIPPRPLRKDKGQKSLKLNQTAAQAMLHSPE